MSLIIKGKIVDVISSCKIRRITRPFDADYRMKWYKLLHKVLDIELCLDAYRLTNHLTPCC